MKIAETTVEYAGSCERCGLRSRVLIYDEVSFKALCDSCWRELGTRRESLAFPTRHTP